MSVEDGVEVGEGSRQINPKNAGDVQDSLLIEVVGAVELGIAGGDVMECEYV